jgi:hypothetical protein
MIPEGPPLLSVKWIQEVLRNVGKYLPDCKAFHLIRAYFSTLKM